MIASAAGYKKPVSEVMKSFQKETGIKTDAAFGNIQMVASQAKQTGEITCIIGDKKFLSVLGSTVKFRSYKSIGKGMLVLAYRKGISLKRPEDIATERIKTLFIPENKKAIYGIAGTEALESYGYTEKLADKITRVATVPQVVSYLLTGEADAGFINLTEAQANKHRLGGYIIIPEDRYTEILIVAGVVEGHENKPETLKFVNYLGTGKAKKIFRKYGLK
ncbi:MAG TPA: molybdate ABC transporter substrate-binding protein [Spirochaetota bacterium]|nr:molybdate ABC transporter substrate-binding protein [Spirochaetota bacterium]HPJ33544.1 molybdate ABC transporter substrate-binding protein [Spirochaetota bacterium]